MPTYLANVDHDFNDDSVGVIYGLHAPDVNDSLLTAILLICMWDKENCMATHSGGNGLSGKENLNEFFGSLSRDSNKVEIKHKEKTLDIGKIEKLTELEESTIRSKLEKINFIEFLSDEARFCAIGRLYDFIRANDLTMGQLDSFEINNNNLKLIVQFLLEKHQKNEVYNMNWLLDLNKIVI